ncbi:MAG TPA: hypothetical protein VHI13_16705 [Candidatus Kapabacteria bacterium]|nr:hypothetical protein [Candidatus Kapabacteria bacterium]
MAGQLTSRILVEVADERLRQDATWGEQNHPMLDQTLLHREGGCTPQRMVEDYEMPSAGWMKFTVQTLAKRGELTYMHILLEEVCEAIECLDDECAMRAELVQVAAVAVAMVECIDRKFGTAPPTHTSCRTRSHCFRR